MAISTTASDMVAEVAVPRPFFSLVVATFGNTDVVECLLESLCEQEAAPLFEVIVVDQNGDDRLDGIVERFGSRIAVLHEKVPFKGASRARNHGASVASGQWLGFPDDDCLLRPGTLHTAHQIIQTAKTPVISGRTVDNAGNSSVLRWGITSQFFTRWSMFRCVTECTLFVERELYMSVGGFDPDFGPGTRYPAAEGIDLVNRLLGVAKRGHFSPAIEFVHASKIPPWDDWAVQRFGSYAVGDGALIAKSPSLPMLYWGARTTLSALRNLVASDPMRRAAYAARLGGLLKGLFRYARAAVRRKENQAP